MPDIILTLTVPQAQRVATAFGQYWGLVDSLGAPRDATPMEVKAYLIRQLRGVVVTQERRAGENALPVPTDLVVT